MGSYSRKDLHKCAGFFSNPYKNVSGRVTVYEVLMTLAFESREGRPEAVERPRCSTLRGRQLKTTGLGRLLDVGRFRRRSPIPTTRSLLHLMSPSVRPVNDAARVPVAIERCFFSRASSRPCPVTTPLGAVSLGAVSLGAGIGPMRLV